MIFNWVDILILAIVAGMIYSGNKSDFITECFKLLGIFLATFLGLHYYIPLSSIVGKQLLIPAKYQEFFAFIL